jgi:hypothetical protein
MLLSDKSYGSLWETPDWALLGTLNGSVGYDSNLTLERGGPSAVEIIANPVLALERHNSDTSFDVIGGVTDTEFADSNLPFESDFSFGANYSYPKADNTDPKGLVIIPIFEASASWVRSSQPNEFLGARVPYDLTTLMADGYVTLTGKLGIRGTGELQSYTYNSTALNDTYLGQGSVGLAYSETSDTQVSLNLGTVIGHSIPNDPVNTVSNVRGTEIDVTARIQGQVTDKITGSAYGGFGSVRYTGGYATSTDLPVAGADLTWGIDTRRTLALGAYTGEVYSPNGEASESSHAFVSFTDVIINEWELDVLTGPERFEYGRQVSLRTDEGWNSSVGFAYSPSKRFRVSLSLDYYYQTSTVTAFKYAHEILTLGASYQF